MIDTKYEGNSSSPAKANLAPVQQRTESLQGLSSQSSTPAHALDAATPPTEEVAALAYQLWIERGSPHGSHEEDWYRAEQQLRNRSTLSKTARA